MAAASLGTFQEMAVQKHSHKYEDRGAASKNVASASTGSTSVANDITEVYNTEEDIIVRSGGLNVLMNETETRPNTMVMNYIIKY